MTGCRISKVTYKDGRAPLHIVGRQPEPWCARGPRNLASIINNDTIMVGFFVMQKNRTVTTGWTYIRGVTDADFMGGIDMMRIDWEKKEMGTAPPSRPIA